MPLLISPRFGILCCVPPDRSSVHLALKVKEVLDNWLGRVHNILGVTYDEAQDMKHFRALFTYLLNSLVAIPTRLFGTTFGPSLRY